MFKRLVIALSLFPLLAVGAWLALALIGGLIPGSTNRIDPREEIISPPVFLIFTPIHADFAIPLTPDIRKQFGFLAESGIQTASENLKYLVIGWGSRAFYTSVKNYADIGFGPTWTAITGDESVMHVQPAGLLDEGSNTLRLDMPRENFDNLIAFILSSFRRDGNNMWHIVGAGFGLGDVFYEARGQFDILEPCNTWVARALAAAGFGTGFWTPTTFSLKIGHKLFN